MHFQKGTLANMTFINSPRWHHKPTSQCSGTGMVYYMHIYSLNHVIIIETPLGIGDLS